MSKIKLAIKSKSQMNDLAVTIAKSSKKGDVIGLKGTLGAGKSFFASCFINSLLDNPVNVQSPTFNIVYSYQSKIGEIYHFDLYRIKEEDELHNIGIEDALENGITIIEWPEIAERFCENNYLEVNIEIGDMEERVVTIDQIKYHQKDLGYNSKNT